MAYGFSNSPIADLKVPIMLDSDAHIAESADAVVASKSFLMKGFKADGSLEEANTVWTEILGKIGGATYDSLSASKTRCDKVEETE